ncbi:unnamed protein product [Nesidiocoris tenuis]|uniref:Uncharacterized protein n=1 Tax=Nesidiocoris tenuis TaxID=355587 RepID=A0A6H5H308_9HEMI|nr:unnamed protein product [Nesidiocoris tenuis]
MVQLFFPTLQTSFLWANNSRLVQKLLESLRKVYGNLHFGAVAMATTVSSMKMIGSAQGDDTAYRNGSAIGEVVSTSTAISNIRKRYK